MNYTLTEPNVLPIWFARPRDSVYDYCYVICDMSQGVGVYFYYCLLVYII
jgi:hypothetical protein